MSSINLSDLTNDKREYIFKSYKDGKNFKQLQREHPELQDMNIIRFTKQFYGYNKDYTKDEHKKAREQYLIDNIKRLQTEGKGKNEIIDTLCMTTLEVPHHNALLENREPGTRRRTRKTSTNKEKNTDSNNVDVQNTNSIRWNDLPTAIQKEASDLYKKGMNFEEIKRELKLSNIKPVTFTKGFYSYNKGDNYTPEEHTISREQYLIDNIKRLQTEGKEKSEIIDTLCMTTLEVSHHKALLEKRKPRTRRRTNQKTDNNSGIDDVPKMGADYLEKQRKAKRKKQIMKKIERTISRKLYRDDNLPTDENKFEEWLITIGIKVDNEEDKDIKIELEEVKKIYRGVYTKYEQLISIRDSIINGIFKSKKYNQQELINQIQTFTKGKNSGSSNNSGLFIVYMGNFISKNISDLSLESLENLKIIMKPVKETVISELTDNKKDFSERILVSNYSKTLMELFDNRIITPINEEIFKKRGKDVATVSTELNK